MGAYKGYVYHPYPKMIYGSLWPLGYKIVKDEAEHQEILKSLEPEKVKKPRKNLKYTIEE